MASTNQHNQSHSNTKIHRLRNRSRPISGFRAAVQCTQCTSDPHSQAMQCRQCRLPLQFTTKRILLYTILLAAHLTIQRRGLERNRLLNHQNNVSVHIVAQSLKRDPIPTTSHNPTPLVQQPSNGCLPPEEQNASGP